MLKDEVLLAKAEGRGEAPLSTLKRPLPAVPRDMPLPELLETFLEERHHMALVVNEYGGTEGLVTLEDVVETLLGKEIVDEMDRVEDMQAMARQRWAVRARALGLDVDAKNGGNEQAKDNTSQGSDPAGQ